MAFQPANKAALQTALQQKYTGAGGAPAQHYNCLLYTSPSPRD